MTTAPVPPLRPDDHVRGDGPVRIVYADFTCHDCALLHIRLREQPVTVVFRHFVALKAKHPRSLALAYAAQAAARQRAFWPFADSLFADQGRLDDPHLWARCVALGIDVDRFDEDRRTQVIADRVQRDVRDGLRAGVIATPSVFADGVPLDWARSDTEDTRREPPESDAGPRMEEKI